MKAVLVIDMLEDFFKEGLLFGLKNDLVENINALTSKAREEGIPVIFVRQEFDEDLSDAFLDMKRNNIKITIKGTDGCNVLSELVIGQNDHEVVKKRYSAFFHTNLDQLIVELGITELILAGVNTHACIRTAAIDAYQRDIEVTIPEECVASYDIEHHEISIRYLGRSGVAKIVSSGCEI